jgi:hypothetical protein
MAAKARALLTENDPDVIHDCVRQLIELAEALGATE